MHKQIRTVPAKSPPDLPAFLAVLKAGGVNLQAAGGGERGGEFAFAVNHGEEAHAMKVLEDEGYHPRLVDVDTFAISDTPGALHACVDTVAKKNAQSGRVIVDVIVGVPDAQKRIQVQIYSE